MLQTGLVCSGAWLRGGIYLRRDSLFPLFRAPLQRSAVLQREQERERLANAPTPTCKQSCLLSRFSGLMKAPAKRLGKFTEVISSLSPSLRVRLTSQPVACLGIRTFPLPSFGKCS